MTAPSSQGIRIRSILDRYLISQLSLTIIFALLIFSIIWLAPDTLFKLTQYVFGGNITWLQALQMMALHLPGVIQQSIPVSVLLGCLFVFQRLSSQFELVAFFAAGISPRRMMVSVASVGVLFALLLVLVQELVVPYTGPMLDHYYQSLGLKDMQDRNFVFVDRDKTGQPEQFFMISQAQKSALSNFIVLSYEPDIANQGVRIAKIIRASKGHWMSVDKQWLLQDGMAYRLNSEGVYQDVEPFAKRTVKTNPYAAKLLQYSIANSKYLNAFKLQSYINLLNEGGQLQDVPYFEVKLYQKLIAPISAIFFAIVGALLGIDPVRSQRSYGLIFGAILVFIYSVLMPFAGNAAAIIWLPVGLVAWFPLVTCALVAWGVLQIKAKLT